MELGFTKTSLSVSYKLFHNAVIVEVKRGIKGAGIHVQLQVFSSHTHSTHTFKLSCIFTMSAHINVPKCERLSACQEPRIGRRAQLTPTGKLRQYLPYLMASSAEESRSDLFSPLFLKKKFWDWYKNIIEETPHADRDARMQNPVQFSSLFTFNVPRSRFFDIRPGAIP